MKGFLKDKFDRVARFKAEVQESFRLYTALLEVPRELRNMLPEGEIVPLTKGEADFAHGIFGDEINTDIIRKILLLMKSQDGTAAAVAGTRAIMFYEPENYSDDFSKEEYPWKVEVFAHELTHIWQHQNGLKYTPKGFKSNFYNYDLNSSSLFTEYYNEQQASIVQEYALRFLMSDMMDLNCLNDDVLLQKIVEDQFPQARITRLAVEAKRAALMAQNPAMAGPAP